MKLPKSFFNFSSKIVKLDIDSIISKGTCKTSGFHSVNKTIFNEVEREKKVDYIDCFDNNSGCCNDYEETKTIEAKSTNKCRKSAIGTFMNKKRHLFRK